MSADSLTCLVDIDAKLDEREESVKVCATNASINAE